MWSAFRCRVQVTTFHYPATSPTHVLPHIPPFETLQATSNLARIRHKAQDQMPPPAATPEKRKGRQNSFQVIMQHLEHE